jgi:hypothetical protein
MIRFAPRQFCTLLLATVVGLVASSPAHASATITIQNLDGASTGFNDPTPATPVGGNNGTTVGQQRLNAFMFAAGIWGATLNSGPVIKISASWASLPCDPDSGTLGSAGSVGMRRDFPNAPFGSTWYSTALANAISGTDQNGSTAEINAQFNSELGTPQCLTGSPWYYGLDGNHGNGVDLVTILLHEFAHGLGFQTFTNGANGVLSGGFPTVYDRFLRDDTTGKLWINMTNAERAASAINNGNLVWAGPQVISDVPNVLGGTPRIHVTSPPALAGNFNNVGLADFGPPLSSPGVTAGVVGTSPADGCTAVGGAVSGKIAFIDRGNCNFTVKVKNAQNAGALAVIIGNVSTSIDPNNAPGMGGTDPTITIPSVSLNLTDANSFRAQLGNSINASILLDLSDLAGADTSNRAQMYAPTTFSAPSSVSHFDTALFPNQLMEPNASDDLTHSVMPPQDLTLSLLRDIGWTAVSGPPPPASIQFSSATGNVNEGAGSITITVTRTGDTSGTSTVDYATQDVDNFTVNCSDKSGHAFARCDFGTSVDRLSFAAGETSKTFQIPIVNDSYAEGDETFTVVLSNAVGAGLGNPSTETITINDNETVDGSNPIFTTPFFVRQHYLDFLSREPEAGEPWSAILNGCPDVNNVDPNSPSASCDRLTVSGAFFGSPEFQLKGYFVYRFYKLAFNRLPAYTEIVVDMRAVTGATPAEVFAKKATFTNDFVLRSEFATLAGLSNTDYVNTLMDRYSLQSITTPDPAAPDGTNKVTLTRTNLISGLNGATLTRAQVLRAIADSDQVFQLEFNSAFVAMQYFGYLRRNPDTAGFNSWLTFLNANPTQSRTMINGFMNSSEYRLRFGPP